jgi:hypothetical protein
MSIHDKLQIYRKQIEDQIGPDAERGSAEFMLVELCGSFIQIEPQSF